MKSVVFSSLFLLGNCSPLLAEIPHRTIAGVSVIDTPIVRDAISYTKAHEDGGVFNHSMRSWVFGSLIINRNPAYNKIVDEEVHALGAILHDFGIEDPKAPMKNDHAALGETGVRNFLANSTEGKLWKQSRVQLVVDSVVLHLKASDSSQALEVRAVRDGQLIDLMGPSGYVTTAEYKTVVEAYPLGKDFMELSPGMNHHSEK
ncbi:hypothetical protein BT63DRAFT_480247 [Microthyrium microscopicum]|uniref:HD domain-containing protein n=1 Tax=Microthyrium microscopicum TaxID=703497 RepID=A0A6A6UBQ8_9PEZI|nr:hypothetical protein BT63DRAFT_480247 [Microthyrium microscopicum]